MRITDRLTLDGLERTSDGYLKASVRVARTGIQEYRGSDVGKPDVKTVKVFRPEAEVFSTDAIRTYAHRPITVDHPSEGVTSENWADVAVGITGESVLRDGEFVMVPILLMDGEAIKTVEGGKRELSMGYEAELDFTPGVTPDGLQFDCVQRNLRMNHLSVVDAARGGPLLRIGDSTMTLKTILVDGLSVETTEAGERAILKLQADAKAISDKLTTSEARVGELTVAVSAKDGEIAVLTAKVKDSEITPAKLDEAVKARAAVIDTAKKVKADIVTDGRTDLEIMRDAVKARVGDAVVATLNDDAVRGAFAALAVSAPPSPDGGQLRTAFSGIVDTGDGAAKEAAALDAQNKRLADAWKRPAATA
jgi:hypothetical protein